MTRFLSTKQGRARERGEMLLEALIGVVLMAIIGIGITYVTSRTSVSQKDMQIQELAVNQMRELLMKNRDGGIDICGGSASITLPDLDPIPVEAKNCTPATVVINGTSVAGIPRPVIIRADIPGLGWIVIGGTW